MQHSHPLAMEEVGEEAFQEEDATIVLRMLLVEDKIKTPFIQVVIGLLSKKFNVIIARNLVIMHMNVGRRSMTKEIKVKTSRVTPRLQSAQFSWHVHLQLNAMLSKKFHLTYGI